VICSGEVRSTCAGFVVGHLGGAGGSIVLKRMSEVRGVVQGRTQRRAFLNSEEPFMVSRIRFKTDYDMEDYFAV
jgi:hypothetical protein